MSLIGLPAVLISDIVVWGGGVCDSRVAGIARIKCSNWGTWGCVIGTLLGVFFFPIGLLLGPFLGAFVGEHDCLLHSLFVERCLTKSHMRARLVFVGNLFEHDVTDSPVYCTFYAVLRVPKKNQCLVFIAACE